MALPERQGADDLSGTAGVMSMDPHSVSFYRCSLSSGESDLEDRAWRDELLHHGDVRAGRARGCHVVVSRHHDGSPHPSGCQGA
jgi:hypothetical protein